MNQIFKGKNANDTEKAYETVFSNTGLTNNISNKLNVGASLSISQQQLSDENLDNYMEKKN